MPFHGATCPQSSPFLSPGPAVEPLARVHRPLRPRTTPLWQLVERYLPAFLGVYEERSDPREGGPYAAAVKRLEASRQCGILDPGFARMRCEGGGREFLLAFSCTGRGRCPSRQKKRPVDCADCVTERVLEPVPHRHVVLSIPRRVRPFFRHHHYLLAPRARCGSGTVKALLQTATGRTHAVPGAIVSVETFGALLDFHPHLHILGTWGVVESALGLLSSVSLPKKETT